MWIKLRYFQPTQVTKLCTKQTTLICFYCHHHYWYFFLFFFFLLVKNRQLFNISKTETWEMQTQKPEQPPYSQSKGCHFTLNTQTESVYPIPWYKQKFTKYEQLRQCCPAYNWAKPLGALCCFTCWGGNFLWFPSL